jgi:hypothetical protein
VLAIPLNQRVAGVFACCRREIASAVKSQVPYASGVKSSRSLEKRRERHVIHGRSHLVASQLSTPMHNDFMSRHL